MIIIFHLLDAHLAYYIKKRIGFGRVKTVKDKKVIVLVIAGREGLDKVINLINGKIKTENIYNKITNNILNHEKYEVRKKINLKLNLDNNLLNHWLAGFSDASTPTFKIQLLTKPKPDEPFLSSGLSRASIADRLKAAEVNKTPYHTRTKVQGLKDIYSEEWERLNLEIKISPENLDIILLIKDFFGGLLSYNKLNNEYTYSSNSYGSARKIIKYFDNYHLLSHKYLDFLRWRKSYILAAKGDYSGIYN